MTIWIDAQLSPAIAASINRNFADIEAKSVRSLGLREAKDLEIFMMAKAENTIIMSKDADFFDLFETFGFPPRLFGPPAEIHLMQTCAAFYNVH